MSPELLNCIMEIAQQMVETGAEIQRVEDSIARLCRAYACLRSDVYATTSNIIVSVETKAGKVLTQSRKIGTISNNLARLDRLNTLVRHITAHAPDCAEIRERLDDVRQLKPYPLWARILCFGLISGSFCLFFGGYTVAEILLAATIGVLIGVFNRLTDNHSVNKILDRFLCSFCGSMLAFIAFRFGLIPTVDKVIIGYIMTLIPGVGLTNSLRDLFTGDTITGILRSIEAVLLALAIAAGYVVSVFLLGGGLG